MIYSIIQKSQLEGALRMDAEYYQPEYLNLEKKLRIFESKKLFDIAQVAGGKRLPIEETFSIEGIPYLRVMDIYATFVDLLGIKYISEKLHNLLKQYQIQKKDILVTIVGNTVGLVGYNQYDLRPFNFTENCARIRAKEVFPEFLLAVLLSKIGQLQVDREKVGTAQPKLSLDRLRNFFIPVPTKELQKKIREIIEASTESNQNAENLYAQAEDLLLEELGLKDFKTDDDLFSIVNLSNVKSARRMDAEYFQPKYEKLISKIKNRLKLEDIATIKRGSLIDPKYYSETEGIPYLRGGDFSSGRIEKSSLIYINGFKLENETRVKTNDIVFASIGSVGTLSLVDEEFDNSFISNNTAKISIKNKQEIIPEYMFIVLQSIVGKWQFERESSQTAQPKISDSQVKNFYIPTLPKPTQQKIAGLVSQSHEARKKAKELLEEAKQKVEELIEK